MRPFVFFPIFPPYSQWRPDRGTNVPESIAVCDQLENVPADAQPFTSTWYCMEFLTHCAITNPSGFKYNQLARSLEAMLLWSFHTRVPLLDWDYAQVQGFLDFYCNPPVECTAVATHSRYLEDHAAPFKDWVINPEWVLFRRTPTGSGDLAPVTRDRAQHMQMDAKKFFEFYLSVTHSIRPNPAEGSYSASWNLDWSRSSATLTEKQLDWLLKEALTSHGHNRHGSQVMVYLGFARYTNLTARQIVGSPDAQFSLDNLRRDSHGEWSLLTTFSGISDSWSRLPMPMSALIERYLQSRHVDLTRPMPNLPLFPHLDDVNGYRLESMSRYVVRVRKRLADAARIDQDPDIAGSAERFRMLSFFMVRRSSRLLRRSPP